VLWTLALAPLAGSNGVSDLAKMLDYANADEGLGVSVVQSITPFSPVI
jgi:hypothetical protein